VKMEIVSSTGFSLCVFDFCYPKRKAHRLSFTTVQDKKPVLPDLRNLARIDAQLFHPREQGSPLKSQAGRGAVRTADASLGLF
jgi:hypothetical protein